MCLKKYHYACELLTSGHFDGSYSFWLTDWAYLYRDTKDTTLN